MSCQNRNITGIKPFVFIDCCGRQIWALIITFHYGSTLYLKDTKFTLANILSIFHADDTNRNTSKRRANRSENRTFDRANGNYRSRFRKTITFYNLNADSPEKFVDCRRKSSATRNTGTEVISEHCANFSKDDCTAQKFEWPKQKPAQNVTRPFYKAQIHFESGGAVEKASINSWPIDCNAHKILVQEICKTTSFPHFSVDSIINWFENTRNCRQNLRIRLFDIRKKYWTDRSWINNRWSLNQNDIFTNSFEYVPNWKNDNSLVIHIYSLTKFIKLCQKISVAEHYALWLSGRSGSKNQWNDIIPIAFFNLGFNSTLVQRIVFFTKNAHVIERIDFNLVILRKFYVLFR